MSFHVGQRVVCVDDVEHLPSGVYLGADGNTWVIAGVLPLVKGATYTIRGIKRSSFDNDICVKVEEIADRWPHDEGFWAHRFRPITEKKTDISIFTAMLQPNREKVSA